MLNTSLTGHPSILYTPRSALWPWVSSICWLSNNDRLETFPSSLRFGATARNVKALKKAGLWVDEGTEVRAPQWVKGWNGRLVQLWKFGPLETYRPPIPAALRQAVYDRVGHKCLQCGTTDRLTLDDIHPFCLG
jgi:hypothetical protein